MSVDLVVPEVAESIHEVQLLAWKKQIGEEVAQDEELVEIETEKATVPIIAPARGRLVEILKQDGDFAQVGDVVGRLELVESTTSRASNLPSRRAADATVEARRETAAMPPPLETPAPKVPKEASAAPRVPEPNGPRSRPAPAAPPAPQRPREEPAERAAPAEAPPKAPAAAPRGAPSPVPAQRQDGAARAERRVRMNLLRQTIARRLVESQQTAALVSTFNEIDMSEVMELRRQLGEEFQSDYQIKLGFMSFFVKAAVDALRRFPEVNASIEGTDIVYHDYFDIGVAIGSGRGLVVPVLRNCDWLSFADIERNIADLAKRAGESKLSPEELQGGTFTISNGGIYGSLLSTPIINPPQSGVLGLHAIQERPIARNGQVVIRPMMYVALTYDHRLVDGREAVGFLRRIKEVIETPARMFLDV